MADVERIIFEEPEQPALARSLTADEAALSLLGPDGDGSPSPTPANRATILVVDDNEIMRTLLTRVLERGRTGIEEMVRLVILQLVPTAVEVGQLVGVLLW